MINRFGLRPWQVCINGAGQGDEPGARLLPRPVMLVAAPDKQDGNVTCAT